MSRHQIALNLFSIAVLLLPVAALAEPAFPPADCDRILFLGDSITYAGGYAAIVETRLRTEQPKRDWYIVNLGLPSETCSGLSEPDHPFPRPDVHTRLDSALEKFKPELVVACYGMNDGIYYPFSEERFAAYQRGVEKLIEKVKAAGAKLILMTPPPFDPVPMKPKGKLLPADAEKFAWFNIYEGYDDVLARYSEWLMKPKDGVLLTIDLHTAVNRVLADRRKETPTFTFAADGIHPNNEGHALLARTILTAFGCDDAKLDPALLNRVTQRQRILRDAWLTHVGHKRPGIKPGLPLEEAEAAAEKVMEEKDES